MSRTAAVRWSALVGAALVGVLAPVQDARAQTGEGVQWTNVVNAVPTGSAIQKTSGCASCADAGGTSLQAIAGGDGAIEFVPVAGTRLYAGLGSATTASTDPALIDFAFSFWPDGGWDIRERNVYRAEGRFASGDVFRVSIEAGSVKYSRNGTVVYSRPAAPAYPLVFDTSLIGTGAALSWATIAGAAAPAVVPVSVTTSTLPDAAIAQPYPATLAASGGSGTYTWTVAAGALPAGLSLSGAGTISGTPMTAGMSSFTVRATDTTDAANVGERSLAIAVTAAAASIAITTTTLPGTRVGEAFASPLAATGGSGTFQWSLAAGALPAGVSLNATGSITGTATSAGRYRVTVRAADAADPTMVDDQALVITVLAATPPLVYDAVTDRVARAKPVAPLPGPAGARFTDPTFGASILRVTDRATRSNALDGSYRTPSGTHSNAWSADARYFYVTSTDGTPVPYSFDAASRMAARLPSASGDGLTLRFFNEPTFSYLTPGVLYGTYTGGNLRSVDAYDLETGVYTLLLNFDTLVANLAGTYTGGLGASAGAPERVFAFFGGTSQDRHYYLVVFDKGNPANHRLLDTLASTVDGVPANITLNFRIHAAAIDRSGRFVTVYPTGTDLQAPRSAAPAYVWDLELNTFTATPLVASRSGGHDAYGYGYRVNQDCCTSSTWDAAQWQLRSLATPLVTTDLIAPVLLPKAVYLADHPSWHNAQPVSLVPFLDATYRYGANTTEWRAWDDEIVAVQTDAAGAGAMVWRFAHHRSNVANDTDPTRISFWYTPRANVSPDGRWALFTSNWEKTLGTDPRGEAGGTFRQDVFMVELAGTATAPPPPPPAPVPVAVSTTDVPLATAGTVYAAPLAATGGSGVFTWSLASGALPAGLTLGSATGMISGTPETAVTATFTVRATDAADAQNSGDRALSLTVAPAAIAPLAIVTTELAPGRMNVAYEAAVERTGGLAPFQWSVAGGALPPGLVLDAATGTISGTPREAGTWSFTVQVVGSGNPASADVQALSIRIRKR